MRQGDIKRGLSRNKGDTKNDKVNHDAVPNVEFEKLWDT